MSEHGIETSPAAPRNAVHYVSRGHVCMRKCVLLVGGYGEVLAMVVGVRGCWARKEAVESERGGGGEQKMGPVFGGTGESEAAESRGMKPCRKCCK